VEKIEEEEDSYEKNYPPNYQVFQFAQINWCFYSFLFSRLTIMRTCTFLTSFTRQWSPFIVNKHPLFPLQDEAP
jgi:hypothetical protein